jgi:hypothetical protein
MESMPILEERAWKCSFLCLSGCSQNAAFVNLEEGPHLEPDHGGSLI